MRRATLRGSQFVYGAVGTGQGTNCAPLDSIAMELRFPHMALSRRHGCLVSVMPDVWDRADSDNDGKE